MNIDQARVHLQAALDCLKPSTVIRTADAVQPALNAALPGDTIELALDAYTVGMLHLPPKDPPGVRLTTQDVLPDRRARADDWQLFALLSSGNPDRTIDATGAANWVLDGIAFGSSTDGHSDVIRLQDAQNITLDRILLVAGPQGQKRGICANGRNITITRSYIANIWREGQDSQAICFWDGAGPYDISDNYLEAASENMMVGGADSLSADRMPSDIRIVGNTFTKNPAWRGQGKAVKNLLEFKCGRRVVILGNTFSQCWTDAQNGYAVLFKSVNQDGGSPWNETTDVLFDGNTITDVENGINIQGQAFDQLGGKTTRVTISNNQITCGAWAIQLGSGAGDVTIDQNTLHPGGFSLFLYGPQNGRVEFTNNRVPDLDQAIKGDGTGYGEPSLQAFCQQYVYEGNVTQ